ncbi:MAG: adenylate cyclase regulatory domain-containing protein [Thermoleophilaceae bacterium]
MAIDFETEGLLEGLDGPAREARLKLLEALISDGYELDELKDAASEGRLALVPVDRVLAGGAAKHSANEIAERTGLDREFLDRNWRALGMALTDPDDRSFTDADMEAAQRVSALLAAGLSEDAIVEVGRVMSRGMFAVASTIRRVFGETYLRAGDDEQSLALRYAEASRELTPLLGPVLEHILSVQQRSLIRQAAVDTPALVTGQLPQGQETAFCFADLVGFTKLGESVDSAALGEVAERLERMAAEVAEPPVRLIKTIGDAAMLQSSDSEALIDAALKLVAHADEEGEDFPQIRAGVAHGEALERSGDWYGRPVNLASRITDIARPGTVLADGAAKREAGDERYRFSFAGKRRIKGLDGEVELHRVRREEPGD